MENHLPADEEAQMDRALHPEGQQQSAPKPASWLDQNGQYAPVIVAMAASFINQLPSGEDFIHEHNVHFIRPLALILFFLFLFAGSLWVFKCEIINSGKEKVKYLQKMAVMILNLLIEAALMAGNVIFLAMVDESYLPVSVSVAVLGFVLLVILFYSEVELDQEHDQPQELPKAVENMVKNCFKISNFTASIGFVVQTAVVIYSLKNPPKDHPQYILIVAFLTSMLGSFSTTITTSPLQFQSDLMSRLLKQMPIIMLLFQALLAVFVAAKILNPTMEVFAVCIPSIAMYLVSLCPKSTDLGENAADEDYKSMYGALAAFGIGVIMALYSKQLEKGVTYLTSAVFFLLMAVITSLMRIAFVFCLKCAVAERVKNMVPMALTLVGVALLLVEFFKDVTLIGMEIAATPVAVPGQVFPPFPH